MRVATGSGNTLVSTIILLTFIILLLFTTLPPLVRKFTWRAPNRLLLTYFGVLPIVLVFLFVQLGFLLVLGQTTDYQRSA